MSETFRMRSVQSPIIPVVGELIREYKVAVIPGTTFGIEDGCYLRVAYGALEKDTAAEGIERLTRGLRAILGSSNGSLA